MDLFPVWHRLADIDLGRPRLWKQLCFHNPKRVRRQRRAEFGQSGQPLYDIDVAEEAGIASEFAQKLACRSAMLKALRNDPVPTELREHAEEHLFGVY